MPIPDASSYSHSLPHASLLNANISRASLTPQRAKVALALLLFFAGAEFIVRGPVRLAERAGKYNDYTSSYVGAKAWMKGLNPYSNDVFWKLWAQSTNQPLHEEESIGSRTPYPWTCLMILAPFSLLGPRAASIALGLIFSAMILAAIWLLSSLPDLSRDPWRRWLFVGLCLALSPIHSGLGQVNISMGAIALVLLGFWALEKNRPGLAGVLIAFSVALKPPIGAFFALFCLLKGQWRAVGFTVATGVALALVAIGRLQLAGIPWLSAYLSNSKLVLTDPINSITAANPKRFQMINLQVLWYSFTQSERSANLLAIAVAGILLAILAYLLVKNKGLALAPLEVGALAMVSLLPVYHRFYDASLLVLPLLWLLSSSSEKMRPYRTLVLVLLLPFLFPGTSFLENMQNAGRIPTSVSGSWWWNVFVLGHEIWALLALALIIVAATWRESHSRMTGVPGFAQNSTPA